jgi:hypothetical protein
MHQHVQATTRACKHRFGVQLFKNPPLFRSTYGTGFPNFHPDLEHFGGGEQSGGGIGDILASRRVKGVLRPGLKHRQI